MVTKGKLTAWSSGEFVRNEPLALKMPQCMCSLASSFSSDNSPSPACHDRLLHQNEALGCRECSRHPFGNTSMVPSLINIAHQVTWHIVGLQCPIQGCRNEVPRNSDCERRKYLKVHIQGEVAAPLALCLSCFTLFTTEREASRHHLAKKHKIIYDKYLLAMWQALPKGQRPLQ